MKNKNPKTIGIRLKHSSTYWKTIDDGKFDKLHTATEKEIEKQVEALRLFLYKKLPLLVVKRFIGRMRQVHPHLFR